MPNEHNNASGGPAGFSEAPSGLLWVIAVVLVAALGWGLEQIAVAPLEAGDVYPAYSSLRSDPLGAKALYESLAALPGLMIERLYKPRTTLSSQTTLLILGVDPVAWETISQKTLTKYEDLVNGGGRLVIAFLPVRARRRSPQASSNGRAAAIPEVTPPEANPPEAKPADTKPTEVSVIKDRWHIQFAYRAPEESAADDDSDVSAIPRHTALSLKPVLEQGPEWRTLARGTDDAITAVERSFGEGTVVLAADSYPLSNEGLREARDAEFIARLAGPSRRILFDENHFGVADTGSVATLMRKYHLEGAVAVLVLVSGLFLWRSASSFLPPRAVSATGAVTGRDAFEGMTALLRRGIPEKDLLDVCYAEWSRSAAPRQTHSIERGQLVEQGHVVENEIARLGKRDPVAAYQAACRILSTARYSSAPPIPAAVHSQPTETK